MEAHMKQTKKRRASDPGHPSAKMVVEPSQWSKTNRPEPSDLLQLLLNVCSSPVFELQSSTQPQSPGSSHPPTSSVVSSADMSSRYRDPSLHDLEQLSTAIALYRRFTPGRFSLHRAIAPKNSVPYLLVIQTIYPESLNPSPPRRNTIAYHSLLRTTRLHQPAGTMTLRTIALGRIWFCHHPTSWVVVMELRGELYALRSDVVAPEELLIPINSELDEAELERISAAPLPVFEKKGVKAVHLGNIKILDPSDLSTSDGYVSLPSVTNWESTLVDA